MLLISVTNYMSDFRQDEASIDQQFNIARLDCVNRNRDTHPEWHNREINPCVTNQSQTQTTCYVPVVHVILQLFPVSSNQELIQHFHATLIPWPVFLQG